MTDYLHALARTATSEGRDALSIVGALAAFVLILYAVEVSANIARSLRSRRRP